MASATSPLRCPWCSAYTTRRPSSFASSPQRQTQEGGCRLPEVRDASHDFAIGLPCGACTSWPCPPTSGSTRTRTRWLMPHRPAARRRPVRRGERPLRWPGVARRSSGVQPGVGVLESQPQEEPTVGVGVHTQPTRSPGAGLFEARTPAGGPGRARRTPALAARAAALMLPRILIALSSIRRCRSRQASSASRRHEPRLRCDGSLASGPLRQSPLHTAAASWTQGHRGSATRGSGHPTTTQARLKPRTLQAKPDPVF